MAGQVINESLAADPRRCPDNFTSVSRLSPTSLRRLLAGQRVAGWYEYLPFSWPKPLGINRHK